MHGSERTADERACELTHCIAVSAGVLDVCGDLSAASRSWCLKYCEVCGHSLRCYVDQTDSTVDFELLLREVPVYFGRRAFTLTHSGKHYGFRVRM